MIHGRKALEGLRFCLVGPGRVGASLAHWAVAAGAQLQKVAGRRTTTALVDEIGGEPVELSRLSSAGTDLLIVAVPDEALSEVARRLARRRQAAVALHTSGGSGAQVLAPLRARGTAVGSCHPLKSFPAVCPAPSAARGTVFAVDGDPPARALARRLVTSWEGETIVVEDSQRRLYHLAATLAAGGVVTLIATAGDLARRLGLPPSVTRGYLTLASGALAAAARGDDPAEALTGPVVRGERKALAGALADLRETAPELADLVARLALETLRQCARREPLKPAQEELRRWLSSQLGQP